MERVRERQKEWELSLKILQSSSKDQFRNVAVFLLAQQHTDVTLTRSRCYCYSTVNVEV